jgi:hypothetical protein
MRAALSEADFQRRRATLDHVLARSRGGATHADNLAVACASCNFSKKDKDFPGEWTPSRDTNTILTGGEFPELAHLSRRAQRIATTIQRLDPEEEGPCVSDFAHARSWKPVTVHRALNELFKEGAMYISAYPCSPSRRYFCPVPDPTHALAGMIWVDGWG